MNRKTESGVALILTLILVLVLSVMGVSLMFLSQTETWSSFNYRLMSEARDGAEGGINATANYIVNTYSPPATGSGTDPVSNYSTAFSPNCGGSSGNAACITYSSNPVILSANFTGQTSNYPVTSVKTAFATAGSGSVAAGTVTVNYNTYAELLNQYEFLPFGAASKKTIQTWRITSDGTVSGVQNATEEVTAILERETVNVASYAAFATSCADGAIDFSGGAGTDSYDSSTTYNGNGAPTKANKDGNVGTNGSLNGAGNPTAVYGSLSTPRNGVGASSCLTGAQDVLTGNANQIRGAIVELPQVITYPTPGLPTPFPCAGVSCTTQTLNGSCGSITGCYSTNGNSSTQFLCPSSGGSASCGTVAYQDINISASGTVVQLGSFSKTVGNTTYSASCTASNPCIYSLNSLSMTGNATLQINGYVVLNIAGCSANNGTSCTSSLNSVLDLTGGSLANTASGQSAYISNAFQILYAGTSTVKLAGSSGAAGVVYAPNAAVQLNSNNGHWYGAIIGNTVKASGGVTIDYDRNLAKTSPTLGNWMLSKFNWKKG